MRLTYLFFTVVAVQTEEILKGLKSHRNWKLIDLGTNCGRSKPSDRIIGGEEAYLGQFPWIVLLAIKFPFISQPQLVCGGSIINDRYILTAAHCIVGDGIIGQVVFVRVGEHDLRSLKDCNSKSFCAPPAQDIPVDQDGVVSHKGYVHRSKINDIALIRLAAPIQFNSPICLPTYDVFKDNKFKGMYMEVAGWGKYDIVKNERANVLASVKVPVLDKTRCIKQFEEAFKMDIKKHHILCAGGVVGKDSCNGDSGGPLSSVFDYGGRPRQFLVGIVSVGDAHCASDKAAVYTRVSDYLFWILDNIRE